MDAFEGVNQAAAPSHYDVQRQRREAFRATWEPGRGVIRGADVVPVPTARGWRSGAYIGADADRPTRLVDATVHELDRGVVTTSHRHSWDAVVFVLAGTGWSEIAGVRYDWRPWDALYLPHRAEHRHGSHDERGARLLTVSSQPVFESLGAAWLDIGAFPAERAPAPATSRDRDDPNARRVTRLAQQAASRRRSRVFTDYDAVRLVPNRKGTRSAFLVDPSIGYHTSGLTMVMTQYGPGLWQAMHRHPGEALLYVVEGRGHSYFGAEPSGGSEVAWTAGDLLVVDHFVWHQHFNDDADRPARLLRIHLMETMLTTMQALLDPLPLLEEPDELLAKAPDAAAVDWPPDVRPA